MLVKLTYYGTGKPTLINLSNVETIYQVADKIQQRISTKIVFKGGNYVNVEEDLQTILGIQNDNLNGKRQSTDWYSPSVDELLENDYNRKSGYREEPSPYRGRQRSYNKREHNDNFYNRH